MISEARWQRATIDGSGMGSLFNSAQLEILKRVARADIRPSTAEIEHAVASIREWRAYLPPTCVAAMIKDGWQWST